MKLKVNRSNLYNYVMIMIRGQISSVKYSLKIINKLKENETINSIKISNIEEFIQFKKERIKKLLKLRKDTIQGKFDNK